MTEISRQQLERELEDARFAAAGKDRVIGTLERRLSAATRELTKLTEGEVVDKDAERVFEAWARATGRDAKRLKFGEKRQQVVKARLRDGYSVEQLIRAVNAVASHPYVVNGRRLASGPEGQRYDELELICRNEVKVDNALKLADLIVAEGRRAWERAGEDLIRRNGRNYDDPSKPRLYGDAFRTWVEALHRAGVEVPNGPPSSGHYMVRCPAHDDRDPSLSWKETASGSISFKCWAGCEKIDVLDRLDLDFSNIGPAEAIGVMARREVRAHRAERRAAA
ncbi:MAG: hypothetical protein M3355_11915 [Actinomycetota bacterium]|nr:hypothetical protein [Actinomycetota bacterium]